MLIEILFAVSIVSVFISMLASILTDYHPQTHFLRIITATLFFITGAALFLYPVDPYTWVIFALTIAIGCVQLAIYNKLKARTGGQPWTPTSKIRHGGITTPEMLDDYPFDEDDTGI